jgi:glutamyl-tRNA(Gln) amidotransferase subunit E
MAEPDSNNRYKEMGFMCGLEIHQRLATSEKLFCSCPANADEGELIDAKVTRYQRAVAGELGQIDVSAEFEESKNKRFVYNVERKNSCLVELDEEPPHRMNGDALLVALSYAEAMQMRFVDEIQTMRKEVVDGSNPSAFQRTAIVGINGKITVDGHEIDMPIISLEEESAGIVSNAEGEAVYDLTRLGIPLVEIDTGPYIPTPEIAKGVALYIGTMLRVSGRVQRGIGSIRQDVNVSIKGGARVEIKGLQELDTLDKFIENEIVRQQRLIEIKGELLKMEATVSHPKEVTDVFKATQARIIRAQLDKGGAVFAFGLERFKGILGREINPDRRLGSEISDYAKMAGVSGIIHSDEDIPWYGITKEEEAQLRKELCMDEEASFVIVAGGKEQAKKAAKFAMGRALHAMTGVPLETRGTLSTEKFTTRFLRPLPGGARMYPETDTKPTPVTKEMVDKALRMAPNVEKERNSLVKLLSDAQLAERLLLSPKLALFKALSKECDPKLAANILLQKFVELRRAGFNVDAIKEERLLEMFALYTNGKITKQAFDEIIKSLSKEDVPVTDLVKRMKLERFKGTELKKIVKGAMEAAKDNKEQARKEIMSKYRLNVDGTELNEALEGK